MKIKILLAIILLIISGCKTGKMMDEINLQTEDNLNIVVNFYEADSDKAVILLHMLGRNKEDWVNFANTLVKNNYNVLALDFRGHGKSDGDLNKFSEKDFNNMVLDVKEAKSFLTSNGKKEIVIIGASIGANTAMNYAVLDNEIKNIVLLSPGLDYRGVKTEDSVKKYKNKILVVSSEDDEYSFESSRTLKSLNKNVELKEYKSGGHGTRMFPATDLEKVLLGWLNKNL